MSPEARWPVLVLQVNQAFGGLEDWSWWAHSGGDFLPTQYWGFWQAGTSLRVRTEDVSRASVRNHLFLSSS